MFDSHYCADKDKVRWSERERHQALSIPAGRRKSGWPVCARRSRRMSWLSSGCRVPCLPRFFYLFSMDSRNVLCSATQCHNYSWSTKREVWQSRDEKERETEQVTQRTEREREITVCSCPYWMRLNLVICDKGTNIPIFS